METKYGVIKSIANKDGISQAGQAYKQYVFELMDGKKYSTFDDKIGSAFKAGDSVEIDGEMKGKYWNMNTMRICTEINKVPVSPANAFKDTSITPMSIVINKTEKPHSYEFGSAKNRHKIYYAEIAELLSHIEALKEAGLIETEIIDPALIQ